MRNVFLGLVGVAVALGSVASPVQAQDMNPSTGMPYYTDDAQIGSWAIPAVDQLQLQGIMTGYPDGSFRPKANITREEFAVALQQAMNSLETRLMGAMTSNDEYLYNTLVQQQTQILEIADRQNMVEEVASSRNWVGISIGATAVDDSDDVLVTLDGKIAILDVAGMYVSVNPFVSTAGEGGASLMLNKELGDKITVSAGAGAAIGWDDNGAITSNAGDVEGFGQAQVEYDLSDTTGLYVNGRVPFTGSNDGDVTIQGGVKLDF